MWQCISLTEVCKRLWGKLPNCVKSEATDSKDCAVFAFECVVLKDEKLIVHC